MKCATRCLFMLKETTDWIYNIVIILFSDMFSSLNISKEKSCSLNVQRLLFVSTTSFSRKIFVFPQTFIYKLRMTLRASSYCFSLDLYFLIETDCVLCELLKDFLHSKYKNSGGNLGQLGARLCDTSLSFSFLCLFLSLFLCFLV
jgi:hypothetical protein